MCVCLRVLRLHRSRELDYWHFPRDAVEIFTTNYDLLFEETFERARAPYFDGFTGGREPFFDPVSVARGDLPPRWTRLWKLHGSLGWCPGESDDVIRTGKSSHTHLVFPEHLKYDQTQKAPYTALLDRLKAFLSTSDTLLISSVSPMRIPMLRLALARAWQQMRHPASLPSNIRPSQRRALHVTWQASSQTSAFMPAIKG